MLCIFYNTIFIPAVIQGWARPRWVVTPAPRLHGGGGVDWVRIEPRTGNQESPGENRTWDWTSTVQRANHWATPYPQWAMPHLSIPGCTAWGQATATTTTLLWSLARTIDGHNRRWIDGSIAILWIDTIDRYYWSWWPPIVSIHRLKIFSVWSIESIIDHKILV